MEKRIKYQSDLDTSFVKEIAQVHGAEKIYDCIQCGTCSGTCPLSVYMDYTPRRIIAMTRSGFKKEVLNSLTIWICSSCYSCTVNCPSGIKVTDVMYALKRKAIESGVEYKGVSTPILAKEFHKLVNSNGRNTESRLMINHAIKSGVSSLLRNYSLGIRLFFKGRLGLKKEKIKDSYKIEKITSKLEYKGRKI